MWIYQASHFAANCPQRGRGAPAESRGKKTKGNVAAITLDSSHEKKNTQQEETIDEALSQVVATLHGVNAMGEMQSAKLGPIPKAEIELEGTPVQAVLDKLLLCL